MSGPSANASGKSQNLDGAVAMVDFNSGSRWLDMVQLGARVILVLEPAGDDGGGFTEAAQKQTKAGLGVPRFYVTRADLSAAMGDDWRKTLAATTPAIKITQSGPNRWEPPRGCRRLALHPAGRRRQAG